MILIPLQKMPTKRPNSLTKGAERKIYEIIKSYRSENQEEILNSNEILNVVVSQPTFSRMKRNLVEKIVERVIDEIEREEIEQRLIMGDDTGESDPDLLDENKSKNITKNVNYMNKSLVSIYRNGIDDNSADCVNLPSPSVEDVSKQQFSFKNFIISSKTSEIHNEVQPENPSPLKKQSPTSGKRKQSLKTSNSKKLKAKALNQDSSGSVSIPTAKLSDLGGVETSIEEILELIAMPFAHPEIYTHTGVQPPRGILLHGPPGCGKTMLANAIAGEIGVPFMQISAPALVSGTSGESEKRIRETFEEAKNLAPCLIFIDEIDAITPKRDQAQREMERRIVAQLLTCMDDLSLDKTNNKPVIIMGATNRPDSIDPALRRAGRFDREIAMNVPDEEARIRILKVMSSKLRLSGDFDFKSLARATPGYVGADLNALTAEAGMSAVKRIFNSMRNFSKVDGVMDMDTSLDTPSSTIRAFLDNFPDTLTDEDLSHISITNDDFQAALLKVQPSCKREGFATVPDVSWDDIGALNSIREELRMAVVEPIQHPEYFAKVGISSPAGVLLWGPPGCGKTLLAKAVANASHSNFISVKGPELLNKYVGESESGVRQVFARARASAPCVIFFDEIDALCPKRDDSQNESTQRVVNTLLTELDGLNSRKQVFIIAATNRPDIIDTAMLRPGRLDKLLYVQLPNGEERFDILKTVSKNTPLGPDVDLNAIAHDKRSVRFSGADIGALVREASILALKEAIYNGTPKDTQDIQNINIFVGAKHFDQAYYHVSPSVSEKELLVYENLKTRFTRGGVK